MDEFEMRENGSKCRLPKAEDIMCGRDQLAFGWRGNQEFRSMIWNALPRYALAESRIKKSLIIRTLVEDIYRSGRRFVKKDSKSNEWKEIGLDKAREKTAHALRDASKAERRRLFPKKRTTNGSTKKGKNGTTADPRLYDVTRYQGKNEVREAGKDRATCESVRSEGSNPHMSGSPFSVVNVDALEPYSPCQGPYSPCQGTMRAASYNYSYEGIRTRPNLQTRPTTEFDGTCTTWCKSFEEVQGGFHRAALTENNYCNTRPSEDRDSWAKALETLDIIDLDLDFDASQLRFDTQKVRHHDRGLSPVATSVSFDSTCVPPQCSPTHVIPDRRQLWEI